MTAEWIVGLTCDWPGCSSRFQHPGNSLSEGWNAAADRLWWIHLHGLDLCSHHPEATDHPTVIVEVDVPDGGPGAPLTVFVISCGCGWSSDRRWRSAEYACWAWLEHLPPEDVEVCASRCAYDAMADAMSVGRR